MKAILAYVVPLLVIVTVPSVLGIRCFNCSSYTEPECASLRANDTTSRFLVECKADEFCRKTTITIIDSDKYVRVTRSCGSVLHKQAQDNCYETDDAFKFEKSCQCFSDGCNASAALRHSVWLLMAVAGAAAWIRNNH